MAVPTRALAVAAVGAALLFTPLLLPPPPRLQIRQLPASPVAMLPAVGAQALAGLRVSQPAAAAVCVGPAGAAVAAPLFLSCQLLPLLHPTLVRQVAVILPVAAAGAAEQLVRVWMATPTLRGASTVRAAALAIAAAGGSCLARRLLRWLVPELHARLLRLQRAAGARRDVGLSALEYSRDRARRLPPAFLPAFGCSGPARNDVGAVGLLRWSTCWPPGGAGPRNEDQAVDQRTSSPSTRLRSVHVHDGLGAAASVQGCRTGLPCCELNNAVQLPVLLLAVHPKVDWCITT